MTATLAVIADGTTNLLLTAGTGFLGMGRHESVARASRAPLLVAEDHAGAFGPDARSALPAVGAVRIALLTHAGRLTAVARSRTSPADILRRPCCAARQVTAAIRETEEGRGASRRPKLSGGATPLMGAAHLGRGPQPRPAARLGRRAGGSGRLGLGVI